MADTQNKRRVLFFPVSSMSGMGEYVRSLCLAKELVRRIPNMDIAFGLNRNVGYVQDCSFRVFPLADTPTRCTTGVIAAISSFKPDVVVFDAAGRVKQLAYCKQNNIGTVFIAQHARKVDRALRLRRLRYTDVVLVAQPHEFLPAPGFFQRLSLKLLNKSAPLYVGPIFPEINREKSSTYLKSRDLIAKTYVLVNAGGGGNMLPADTGKINASELFLDVTKSLALKTEMYFVVVMGRNYTGHAVYDELLTDNVQVIPWCEEEEFNALLSHASAGLLSGGSSLLQALASGLKNILAVPVANDQKQRIRQCEKFYGIKSSKPAIKDIELAFAKLLAENKQSELSCNQEGSLPGTQIVTNGLDLATKAIQKLLDNSSGYGNK